MRILITICALVLFGSLPLFAKDTGEREKNVAKEEGVVEPVKKEKGLMDVKGGESADTMVSPRLQSPAVKGSIPVSGGVPVDEQEEKEKDLPYLDEDQDE